MDQRINDRGVLIDRTLVEQAITCDLMLSDAIDQPSQIEPFIQAVEGWVSGEPFPEGIGAGIPELGVEALPDVNNLRNHQVKD